MLWEIFMENFMIFFVNFYKRSADDRIIVLTQNQVLRGFFKCLKKIKEKFFKKYDKKLYELFHPNTIFALFTNITVFTCFYCQSKSSKTSFFTLSKISCSIFPLPVTLVSHLILSFLSPSAFQKPVRSTFYMYFLEILYGLRKNDCLLVFTESKIISYCHLTMVVLTVQ